MITDIEKKQSFDRDFKNIKAIEFDGHLKVSLCDVCNFLKKHKVVRNHNSLYWELSRQIFETLGKKGKRMRNDWDVPFIINGHAKDIYMSWVWYTEKRFKKILTVQKQEDKAFLRLMWLICMRTDVEDYMTIIVPRGINDII